jgi:hypothetical protein
MSKIAAAVFAAALTLSAQTAAAVVLDQASVPESGKAFDFAAGGYTLNDYGYGQSFTVGVDGVLDHVDVGVFTQGGASANPLTFKLLDDNGALLFSQTFSPAPVAALSIASTDWADLLSVSVRSAAIQVTAGQKLRWGAFSSGPSASYSLLSQVNNDRISYAGGDALIFAFGPGGFPFPTADMAFRTYVETAVPEPSAWALTILGFAGAGGALRHRRRMAAA